MGRFFIGSAPQPTGESRQRKKIMAIYVVETFRSLGRMGNLRQFQGCNAKVMTDPSQYYDTPEKFYRPDEWQALLRQEGVLYRHKDDKEFRKPYVPN